MAYATRITIWSAGDTLTASALNAEMNIAINASKDGTVDSNVANQTINGNQTVTGTQTVTGATALNGSATLGDAFGDLVWSKGRFVGAVPMTGWVDNLGLTLSSGTLSITDNAGAALSNTNPAYVAMTDTTGGLVRVLKVTAPATFNDDAHASSDLTNVGFGITEAAHWANDMPFFLYAVNRGNADIDGSDGNSCFALARNPAMSVTPSSANNIFTTTTSPTTDDQTTIMLLGTYTGSNYTSKPCQLIGAIRMQWSTTSDDWTVQTLATTDGFGPEQLRKTFSKTWTYPTGQNGASAGSFFNPNGGTAPTYTEDNTYTYQISPMGIMTCEVGLVNTSGGTGGAGAVVLQLTTPYSYTINLTTSAYTQAGLMYVRHGASLDTIGAFRAITGGVNYVVLDYQSTIANGFTNITNAGQNNATRSVIGRINLRAFVN